MDNIGARKIFTSFVWKFLERSTQGFQLVIQIILARLLEPEDFGVIALVTIFIAIANVFVQSGFNTAIIQKKEVDEIDLSSTLYISLIIAVLLYISLFIFSPNIAKFFDYQVLSPLIKVLGISLIFGAFNSVQIAIISRTLDYKKIFISSLISMILSGVIGIILAFLDFGVWALVWMQLANKGINSIVLFIVVRWFPKRVFNLKRVRSLFSFGSKILLSSLLDTVYMNLRSIFVGKFYTPDMLGFFNRGKQFPEFIATVVNGSIQSIIFPVLSHHQDDSSKVKYIVRSSIGLSSFFIFPIMFILAIVSEPLIRFLLTPKWLSCVPFMQVFCLSYALWPIHTANLQAIKALGRSDLYLILEIIKKVIGTIILLFTVRMSVYAMAIGLLISSLISLGVNTFPNKILLKYSYSEQIRDITPSLLLTLVMSIILLSINIFELNYIIKMVIQILLGVVIYIFLAKIFKVKSYVLIKNFFLNNYKRT